jgi:hypothetical protein
MKTGYRSTIGLLAIDQSVLILKKGNDIEQKDVFKSLEGHDALKVETVTDK